MEQFTSFDISLWEDRVNKETSSREAERQRFLKNAIPVIRNYFSDKRVEEVYLFGSILRERNFYDFSDIDIYVTGLKEDYFRTLCELEELLGRDVDLVDSDDFSRPQYVVTRGMKVK